MYKKYSKTINNHIVRNGILTTGYTIKMIVLGIVLFQAMMSYANAYERIVVIKCLGDIEGVRYLNGQTKTGKVELVDDNFHNNPYYSGTKWQITEEGFIKCLGDVDGVRYLNGQTQTGKVELIADNFKTNSYYSGTKWQITEEGFIKCLGDVDGVRYLNGQTQTGKVELIADNFKTNSYYSGTKWELIPIEGQDPPSDCKSLLASISIVDASNDVSKAPVVFSSSTFKLNFPSYCQPVDIYFAIFTPDNKLIFTDSNGRLTLEFTPYTAGATSSINTSFSVAGSALASELTSKCVPYWLVAPANGGDILKSLESEKYELGWYNIEEAVVLPAGSSRVPDTGVTKCYNYTEEIPCPSEGEDLYGQDGSYSINPMSYTKLDENCNDLPITATSWAMVRDNVTGLIWENKNNMDYVQDYTNPHDSDNTYTWYDSNPAANVGDAGSAGNGTDTEDFIKALNSANFGGHSDWRLPTPYELSTIIDYSIPYPGPTINTTYFKDIIESFYWSSTTSSSNNYGAWGVSFSGGLDSTYSKYDGSYVRAVRCGQSVIGSLDNLVINGNGTVTDSATGLMWQQDASKNRMTWNKAVSYCQNLNLGGYTDWRLPTIKELRSIVDYSRYYPAINTNVFNNAFESFYWSSTTYSNYTYYAWGVDFSYGYDVYYGSKNYYYYVRAVRGEQ